MRCRILIYNILTMLAVVMSARGVHAQTYELKGSVKDASTEAVIVGATVVVQGTQRGTTTNTHGTFVLDVREGEKITVTYIGYEDQTIAVHGQNNMVVSLKPSSVDINEVVVVGYGTMRKSDLTGSISSLSGKQIEGFKSGSILNAMSGQIAGVQIGTQDGTPGGGIDITIRGMSTISGESTPLYVVDGFQVDNLDFLASNDIQSIEILKDASAAAIYGSRAANGVVLVTTKSGHAGRTVVNVSTAASYREMTKKLSVLSPYEFVKLQMEVWPQKYEGRYYKAGNDENGVPYRYQTLEDYRNEKGVDWQDETFRPTWSFDTNVSVSGGTDKTKYSLSYSNFKEDGVFINSGYSKNTAKLRVNQRINKVITADFSLNYSQNVKSGTGTSADNGRFNILRQILQARPTGGLLLTNEELLEAPIDPDILESDSNLAQVNPVLQANSVDDKKVSEYISANLSLNFKISNSFTFRSAGSYGSNRITRDIFYRNGSKEAYRAGMMPLGSSNSQADKRWSFNNYLTYKTGNKSWGRLDAMLGQEIVFNSSKYLQGKANNFASEELGTDNMGLGTPTSLTSSYWDKTLISFFGRVNYNYKERYLLTATLRDDGSTVFAKKNKWTIAPSASFAWRISEEQFMQRASVISNLKLRVGWGIVGNDRIPSYLSLPLYEIEKYGVSGNLIPVLINKQLPNADIGWESSMTTNVGIDLSLFNSRINLTVDGFIKDTRNMLLSADKPYVSGFEEQYANIGKIRNKGIEITLGTVNINRGSFLWKTDFNISFIRNTVQSLVGNQQYRLAKADFDSNITNYDYIAKVGSPLGLMYGYQVDGVYQYSDFDINASTGQMTLKPGIVDISSYLGTPVTPGVVKYRDVDNNGVIDENDRTVIGNGYPKWFGGINNTFAYKNFDFNIMFQFNYGNDIFNAMRMSISTTDIDRYNMSGYTANRWTPNNATNEMHSATGYIRYDMTSEYIEDGSFLRLKNIALGYTLPRKWTSKIRMEKIRLYVSAQNLWILSDYTGSDPEVSMRSSNPMTPGVDYGAYPKSRVISFGLDVQF